MGGQHHGGQRGHLVSGQGVRNVQDIRARQRVRNRNQWQVHTQRGLDVGDDDGSCEFSRRRLLDESRGVRHPAARSRVFEPYTGPSHFRRRDEDRQSVAA